MTEFKDDPRQVLALLNSLGFVGITAPQLKAFMKDLKMYRKVKALERQQWKDETKEKILSKQECAAKKFLRDAIPPERPNYRDKICLSDDSSQQEDSLVRIQVRCTVEKNDSQKLEGRAGPTIRRSPVRRPIESTDEIDENAEFVPTIVNSKSQMRKSEKVDGNFQEQPKIIAPCRPVEKPAASSKDRIPLRPISAPNAKNSHISSEFPVKSAGSDPARSASNPSGRSTSCASNKSRKSFIRPWALQPNSQALRVRKSDPVALYQKYQQAWKTFSLPGEENHSDVRWAIREKMMGINPNPRPKLSKSQSLTCVKKR